MQLCLLHLIGHRQIEKKIHDRLDAAGFTDLDPANGMIFPLLTKDGVKSIDLAKQLGVTRQAVYKNIQSLKRQGLVELSADPKNLSAKLIHLTQKGNQYKEFGDQAATDIENELIEEFGEETITELKVLLTKCWAKKAAK